MKRKNDEIQRFTEGNGLNSEQVQLRVGQKLTNRFEVKTSRSYLSIVLRNLLTVFNIMWFAIAGILLYIGAYQDCFFLIIIIANLLIGIIQEIKAKQAVEKLSLLSAPTAVVIRDGERREIPCTDVVLDDVMILSMGKQICCDSVVLEGSVEVNESLLTGESIPVKKGAGDRLYAGSFLSSGQCSARVDKVGVDNYVQQLAKKAKKLKDNQSQLLKSLKFLINIIAVLIVPLTTIVVLKNMSIFDGDVYTIITKSSGAVVGMIPSGMFLLTSLALAVGIIRLAARRTLVQDLYSIEMLARSTTLCLDKTGTITDGTMIVRECISLGDSGQDIEGIVSSILYATKDDNPTAKALKEKFGANEVYKALAALPFSSARKLSAAYFEGMGTLAIGASEFVLGDSKEIAEISQKYLLEGNRVLCLAKSRAALDGDDLPKDFEPIALIVLEDHIREQAAVTIAWFKQGGVKVKVISGDNPLAVSKIAAKVGIEGAEQYVSLDGMSDEEVKDAATRYTVFGRVTPDQKALLIKSMKEGGETVAMTGDGINDILAMKESDCSIAMASGSEAARNVSNLVLLDSDFSCMPGVVAEGRRVINNITKSSAIFLMKTFFVILIVLLFAFFPARRFGFTYPFSPKQMLLLEVLVIGLPSFFLALQPNAEPIRGNFLPSVVKKSMPAALLMVMNVFVLFFTEYLFGTNLGINFDDVNSMAVLCVTFTGFEMLALMCYKFNAYRGIMFLSALAASVISLFIMPETLGLVPLSLHELAIVGGLLAINLPLLLLLYKLFHRIKR